jgi:S1-C subfamily serine protease
MGTGYWLSFLTKYNRYGRDYKARSIGIINRSWEYNSQGNSGTTMNTAIESFIQTDAAINPEIVAVHL